MPTSFAEGRHTAEFLISEAPGYRSRESITLANTSNAEVSWPAGLVLARNDIGAATRAAKAGGNAANTGDLTLDATTPVLAGAQAGIYAVRCIATASNGGTFRVTDPKGNVLGDVAVGATFANQVKFAIADGSQDFVVGEGFDITIAAGDGRYIPFLNAANLPAVALLYDNQVVAATGTRSAVVFARDIEANAAELRYDASLSGGALTAAKAAARAALAAAGIILR